MRSTVIRVLIADDHPIIISGIRQELALNPRIQIVGTAADFDGAIQILSTYVVDVLILDLTGMRAGPLVMLTRLRRDYPTLRIVIYSSLIAHAPELLDAGAHGYVGKEEPVSRLREAIQAVVRGERYLSPAVVQHIETSNTVRELAQLAPRELEALRLLSEGLSTLEIAERMGISAAATQNYITTLRRKTNCVQRTQLVEWYRQSMLLDQ